MALACFWTLAGCAGYPEAADLDPDVAWEVTRAEYDRGYSDETFARAGLREGSALGDIPGLAGDAWRLGRDDQRAGRPCRTPGQLRAWLLKQPGFPAVLSPNWGPYDDPLSGAS